MHIIGTREIEKEPFFLAALLLLIKITQVSTIESPQTERRVVYKFDK